METAIEIRKLAFTYKDQTQGRALEGIDLDIARGEFLMILGPSGAGKSTLANCLNGIIPNMVRGQYEGTVLLYPTPNLHMAHYNWNMLLIEYNSFI